MTYGIKTLDANGYINLHSDYSSIVYYGEMSLIASPQRPVYTSRVSFAESVKDTNYDMGWLTQYQISGINTDYLLPFYRPNFDNQQIGILDVIKKDSTTWIVNLIYNGNSTQSPRVFAFAPLSAIPKPTLSAYGLVVYDQNGGLVFTDSKPPLRVDDSVVITHPSAIRTTDKGSCGRFGYDCHVNFTSDKSNYFYGTVNNTSTKLYHIVPSAYGGLAYKNYQTGSESCEGGLGSRKWVFNYQSWASFRGTVAHSFNTDSHKADWLADYAGAIYQSDESGCGAGGILGLVLGALAVIFTGGGALAFVGGYLVGFALSAPQATPSLKAYETDQVFDTNNPSNLIITDARYYGIDGLAPADSIDETPADQKIYYNFYGTEIIYSPNKVFWLETYGTTNADYGIRLSIRVKDTEVYPDTDITDVSHGYVDKIYDPTSGYFYQRSSLIMTYPDNSQIYSITRTSFRYTSPIGVSSSNVTYYTVYKWVVTPPYANASNRYKLEIFYNQANLRYAEYVVTYITDPTITSYTYGGYTYIRGPSKKYIPADPANYIQESMEYSVIRI